MSRSRERLVCGFLVALGSVQMIGDVLDVPRLKAFGAATQVAPAMKVFTAHRGHETFANRFHLGWRDRDGHWSEVRLDPRRYAAVRGPYNRRNAYGAALAYGPLLRADPRTRDMHASVVRYALCEPGALRAELGIPGEAAVVSIRIEPIGAGAAHVGDLTWETDCDE
jgi:hypothetical protein